MVIALTIVYGLETVKDGNIKSNTISPTKVQYLRKA